jgi:hypothetical protein
MSEQCLPVDNGSFQDRIREGLPDILSLHLLARVIFVDGGSQIPCCGLRGSVMMHLRENLVTSQKFENT